MKTYTLKLKTTSTVNYNLYDGTTALTDAEISTLFTTAGEAYFVFDFNSLTPTNTTSLNIVDSNDTAVVANTGLSGIAEGVNFKGEWGASATSFTSFAQLPAYGLDESQLGELASLAKSGQEIITKEITANVNAWSFFGGADAVGKIFRVRNNTNISLKIYFDTTTSGTDIAQYVGVKKYSDTYFIFMLRDSFNGYSFVAIEPHGAPGETGSTNAPVLVGGFYGETINYPQIRRMQIGAIDDLTTTSIDDALSANQGKVLNERIGDLTTLTTTDKTSAVAAINELAGEIGGGIKTLTTADYNYHHTGSTDDAIGPWLLDAGYYITEPGLKIFNSAGGSYSTHPNSVIIIVSKRSDWSQVKYLIASGGVWTLWGTDLPGGSASQTLLGVVDGLGGGGVSGPYVALSANQGKVLKDLIDSLVIKGSGAPTTSTVGTVGMLYEDTTNGKLYQCTDATNPYVWAEVGGGGGVSVVQTTGTSATDVMSQKATTNMIFPEGSESTLSNVLIGSLSSTPANLGTYNIRIGSGVSTASGEQETVVIGHGAGFSASANNAVSIGHSASAKSESVAIGHSANANVGTNTVAVGHSAQAFTTDTIAIGSNIRVNNAGSVVIGNGHQNNTQYTTRANEFCVHASATANQPMVHSNVDTPTLGTDAANKDYVDSIYPVGAVFTSTSATAPTIAGGTWTEIGTQTIGSSTVHYYERTA